MKRTSATILGSSLLLWASVAGAQAAGAHTIDTTTTHPRHIVGSDTLNAVLDSVMADLIALGDLSGNSDATTGGYTTYLGIGSSAGERQLAGGTANAGEPACTPTDGNGGAEGNPGCLEISPMSRELQSGICDDDHDDPDGTGTNTAAEGMAICRDGLVVITNNANQAVYGNDATACSDYLALANTSNTGNSFPDREVGALRESGVLDLGAPGPSAEDYTIGGGTLGAGNEWKDVLRLIYTGCDNNDGACAAADDRVARCGSAARQYLVDHWDALFEDSVTGGLTDCAGTQCSGGLRMAYRRDDASGTTGAFLEFISVAFNTSANIKTRARVVAGVGGAPEPMPTTNSYCDGGQVEGFFPTNFDGSGTPKFDLGDPIRKNCAPEDDLCAFDGKLPIVRPIRSTVTPDPLDPLSGYPEYQCTKNQFARKAFITSTLKICPDGTKPTLAGCKFPYYVMPGGSKNFDCLNQVGSRPLTVPISTDGRSYNYVMHLTDGTVRMASGSGSGAMPQVASWRQNMAQLSTVFAANAGFAFGPSPALGNYVCTESDATRNIGCLVSKTSCTIGFAGREAAYSTANDYHLQNEPVKLKDVTANNTDILANAYPFARDLWINAAHGFENLTDDCEGRNGTADQCADELALAMEFYNVGEPGNLVTAACEASGFVPKPAIECRGALTSATCGAPTIQAKSECLPQ